MSRLIFACVIGVLLMPVGGVGAQSRVPATDLSSRQLFVAACANCHGSDGRGATQSEVGFPEALPDFTDCSYATREAAKDWVDIVHGGGRVRALSHRMPSFGSALTRDQLERVVTYVRSLCDEKRWPRGELNLPRATATEKAFPEDETVLTVSANTHRGERAVDAALQYERRFGARSQIELTFPFGLQERPGPRPNTWSGVRLGDIAVAYKGVLFHSDESGSILSTGAEVSLPTGDTESGAGSGVTTIEPFLLAGQILPWNSFVQLHAAFEMPMGHPEVSRAAFARAAVGTTFTSSGGRIFTPMAELIADRDFETGAITQWDWIPQIQVSLSKRRHVLGNVGVQFPLTEPSLRRRRLVAYFIWDWYEGGLFEGW